MSSIVDAAGSFSLAGISLPLSRVGLGTWALGGQQWRYSWGKQDDAASLRTIDAAIDVGVNWIDTAPVYGVGHAERLVGRALHGRRDRVVVATKCGFLWQPGSHRPYPRLTAATVFDEVEASLRRLATDYIDLYQIHWPGPDCDLLAGWESICRLIEAGKVRSGGVCNLSAPELASFAGQASPASLQLPCNMLLPPPRELVAAEAGDTAASTTIIGYSPLASGMLCQAFSHQRVRRLPGDDWRASDARFSEPQLSAHLHLVEELRSIGASAGRRVEHYALTWALQRVVGGAILLGARSPEQIVTSAGAETPGAAEMAAVERVLNTPRRPAGAPGPQSAGRESAPLRPTRSPPQRQR